MCVFVCVYVRGYANDSNNFEWPGHYIMIRGTGRPVGGFFFLLLRARTPRLRRTGCCTTNDDGGDDDDDDDDDRSGTRRAHVYY